MLSGRNTSIVSTFSTKKVFFIISFKSNQTFKNVLFLYLKLELNLKLGYTRIKRPSDIIIIKDVFTHI